MTKIDTTTLKTAYLASGGTEDGWHRGKDEVIEQARRQQAVTEALAAANRKPSLNDLMREQLNQPAPDLLGRLFTQKGTE
jgi:hypothetical protein